MYKNHFNKNETKNIICGKIGLLSIFALMIILTGLVIISCDKNEAEIYSYYGQTVQLLANGDFTASLAHGVKKSGTYSKKTENDIIIVTFNVNGNMEAGRIINNSLHLPNEWDDGHGHGDVFPKVNEMPSNQRHKEHNH